MRQEHTHITYDFHDTALGRVMIGMNDKKLCWLSFIMTSDDAAISEMKRRLKINCATQDAKVSKAMKDKIDDFIAGKSNALPDLKLSGTPFQETVWQALLRIPRGKTVSYKDIANDIGKPKAVRAVGGAVGANPISLFVPCHRVLASNGAIGGYAWGVERKRDILNTEKY